MMNDMIWTLIVNTAVFSLLAGALLLVRKLFGRKLSAVLQYALWAVVLIKLVIPFGFESALSPLNWFASAPAAITQPITPGKQASPPIDIETAKTEYKPQTAIPTVQNTAITTSPSAIPSQPVQKPLPWEAWALMAWGAGAIATGGWLLLCRRHLRKRMKHERMDVPGRLIRTFVACKLRLGIRRDIGLCMHAGVQVPAITGLFRPVLMLPGHLENADTAEMEHIFLHELTHYKNGDLFAITILNLLTIAYWFNPVLWLCSRLVRKDMETLCDQKVLAMLDRDRQNGYVRTVLKYAGIPGCENRLQAAMSLNDGRCKMERRIHDMFKKKKTGKGTRVLVIAVAILMLASCAFTACQPTPDEPAVVGKDGDSLNSIIKDTASPTGTPARNEELYSLLGAPAHWKYETEGAGGKLKVVADADITLPGVSKLPAATAKLRDFPQEEINKVVSTIIGDNLTFTETVRFTKEELEQLIIEAKKSVADQAAGVTPGPGVHVIYDQKDVDYYQSLLPNAPFEKDLKIKDLTVEPLKDGERSYRGVSVNTKVDGQNYSIRAGSLLSPDNIRYINITSGSSRANYYAFFGGTYLKKPYGVSLSKEQAGEQAKKIAAKLTNELTLCYVAPTAGSKQDTVRNWGWACVFMREINGCPTAYATEDVGQSMESNVQKPVRYEKMIIIMDDQGVTGFSWENPMTVTKVDNDNVNLLSFEKIAQKGVAQLIQKFSKYGFVTKGTGGTITITRVELGLMRVAKKNSPEYYFIPVWNFFNQEKDAGYLKKPGAAEPTPPPEVDEQGDPSSFVDGYPDAWGSVTINALDGSVIDKDVGY